jgi:hypothetical protein
LRIGHAPNAAEQEHLAALGRQVIDGGAQQGELLLRRNLPFCRRRVGRQLHVFEAALVGNPPHLLRTPEVVGHIDGDTEQHRGRRADLARILVLHHADVRFLGDIVGVFRRA